MNILIAPNPMKGSLDSKSFAACIGKGFREVSPVFNLREVPLADGGDDTGKILTALMQGRIFRESATGPAGGEIFAEYAIAGRTAIIEMASASGLRLLGPGEANPEKTTSRGTGELIRAAVDRGCTRILLGAGGSATVDGGIGMLGALGFSFFDVHGSELKALPCSLGLVERIQRSAEWPEGVGITILADVDNPLCGEQGAARIFGPQKGADQEMVLRIEERLSHWIGVLEREAGTSLRDIPGMGAAGGVASGLVVFLNGRIVNGAGYIFDLLEMEKQIAWADWIITGEGCADKRGGSAKAPGALARLASAAGKPVTMIAGSYDPDISAGYDGTFSISNGSEPLAELLKKAAEKTTLLARQIASILLKSYPENFKAHQIFTEIENLIREGKNARAQELLEVISQDACSHFWYLKGLISFKSQDWGNAMNHFRKSFDLDPGNSKPATNLTIIQQILSFRNPDLLNP
ncbi:MAG: glycerate kinase [Bacteroidota bacterium]|jgi:glycerate kinase|nr:glycerate kinase [Prolixibacteraceae bacterium]MDI9565147.1 glycerate kinase [Bacteroidota bacterium]NLS99279.1 glycerate kinase [Bacteroidales bacterium]OQB81313.1 MAG: Glycerate 2-kinase [Bacteroidetes bacterium ADurb.Bin123]HNU77141.1 glycerate kinase [Prolixibacteraceae bacterium]